VAHALRVTIPELAVPKKHEEQLRSMMDQIINMSKVNNEMQTPTISVITINAHVFTTKMDILQATNSQVQ
jgi:hypothetical protein